VSVSVCECKYLLLIFRRRPPPGRWWRPGESSGAAAGPWRRRPRSVVPPPPRDRLCFGYNDERDRKLYVDDERISGAGGGADRGRKTTAGE